MQQFQKSGRREAAGAAARCVRSLGVCRCGGHAGREGRTKACACEIPVRSYCKEEWILYTNQQPSANRGKRPRRGGGRRPRPPLRRSALVRGGRREEASARGGGGRGAADCARRRAGRGRPWGTGGAPGPLAHAARTNIQCLCKARRALPPEGRRAAGAERRWAKSCGAATLGRPLSEE
ncbi:MAG: hypothetical protein J3K34DRAFT_243858 [Monoraphidium minutum]|nr:MAG: hypothetical protein J3K34DRAFT_243858 [Monoraphidium minutum]